MSIINGLEKKKVLITGGSSGIGACTAELFASFGATVGIHYNSNEAEALVLDRKIRENYAAPVILKANLLVTEDRESIVPEFVERAGGLDILVNNAGSIIGTDHFLRIDLDSWEKTVNLNLTAPFFIARDSFSHMKEHGGGRIINISSIAAKYGGSVTSIHYGAAKAGIEAVTRTLAKEGAQYNILVNAIQPGVIDTGFHQKIGRSSLTERVKSIPLKKAGTPLDVARMCIFLASDAGGYITGQIFGVTGGD